jgi:hypothetical protein
LAAAGLMTRTRPTIQKRGGAEQCRPMWDATMRHPMAVYFLQQSTKFDCHRTTAVARTTKRHDQIEDGPGCGGWVNMNDIVARVLLFFAYGSIVVATTGWFASTRHAVGMGVLALPGESRAIFPDNR